MKNPIEIKNKKASFSYNLTDFFIAGIQLKGSEIKSIRNKDVIITDSYCTLTKGEIWARNINIKKYKQDSINEHNPKREKKLLLNKSELKKITKSIDEKGMSLIPTRIFINKKGLAKIEIAIGKGKKQYDKREDIKKRDIEKQIQIEKKRGN
tara:strand:- start:711 stop:1166 length:456 start_codon:yes stop_codon:yes gene_type:complete